MSPKDILEITVSVIVSLGGGGAIVFGFSGYLGKVWADRALEKQRQENAKLNLEVNHQLGLVTEQMKSVLQQRAVEHQVQFSRLHASRAEVIEELDRRLYELQIEGQQYVELAGRAGQEAYSNWRSKFVECNSFLDAKQIYLTDQLYASVSQYLGAVKRPLVEVWAITCIEDGEYPSHDLLRKHSATILAAIKDFTTEIPAMRYGVIKEFRALLGGAR